MILNGKAKEDFIDYIDSDDLLVESMSEVYRNALIIEWLDSVGIYIDILHSYSFENTLEFCAKVSNTYVTHGIKDKPINRFEKRIDATEKAIIKANEIYNDTNKESANRLP